MTTVTATAVDDQVQLRFGFDPWLIAAAKSIPGARLISGGYLIPRHSFPAFCEAVGSAAVKLTDPALEALLPADPFDQCRPTEVLGDFRPRCPTWSEQNTPHGLTGLDYQATGSTFLIRTPRALLLDEMGLGKTKQLIDAVSYAFTHHCFDPMRVLIVAKASSVSNWRSEIEQFSEPCDVRLLRGSVAQRRKLMNDNPSARLTYFVTSWATMRIDSDLLGRMPWDWIVLDEAHLAKSTPLNGDQSQQAKAIHKLHAPRRTAMTGTFIINAPQDAWNVLRWLEIEKREWAQFERDTLKTIRYSPGAGLKLKMVVGHTPHGIVTLRNMIGKAMVRRTKDQEMPDLPPYIRTNVEVMLTDDEAKRYRAAEDESFLFLETLSRDDGKEIQEISIVLRLKQITSTIDTFSHSSLLSSKIDTARSLVDDLVDSGQKVLIGTQFIGAVQSLAHVLAKYHPAVVHGSIQMLERDAAMHRFQTDPECKVFIASVAACREAVNLTAASAIIHIDKEWSQAYVDQFEARARRIGSEKHNCINVYTLQALLPPTKRYPNGEKTIDHGIASVLEKKQHIAKTLTETKSGTTTHNDKVR